MSDGCPVNSIHYPADRQTCCCEDDDDDGGGDDDDDDYYYDEYDADIYTLYFYKNNTYIYMYIYIYVHVCVYMQGVA